jgi:tetratricopeptide (TPR) repeat protein
VSQSKRVTVLHDRYQLGEELGRGGMGVVYSAHDPTLDREVAVKVLSQSGLGTEGRSRLLTEAQAVAKLNHPNIVTVHDAGELEPSEDSGQAVPYIVMELVEGKSLLEQRPEDFEVMVETARQVCAALEHAHQNGIIHRDLKPENVIVEPDGTAKLMDFGLARSVATRVSVEGDIVGTVFYLAPEQAMGHDLDGRADLYSLGVILYELTTGELPFMHEDPLAVVSQHLHATVLPPRSRNPQIPPLLEELILRLLSKDPDDRPESAAALSELLQSPDLLDPEAETEKELSVIGRIVRGRFVGREQELEQAKAIWSKALGGAGQTLLVSGEPGIGKTRLARELATHVEVSGGRALVGECYAEGGAPYAAFAQIVRNALRNQSKNGFEVQDFVLADLLSLAPELRPYYPDVPPNPPLEPEAEQQRLFENVVAFCDGLAEHAPLMLVIDDAHWGDSSTLAMMRHLARRIKHQRTLLLTTYREVELDVARPFHEVLLDINRARLGTRLKLERFNKQQTHDLLHAIFEEEITPEFLDGIHRETEGNPFYIEEVCKALVEDGRLYYEDGRWHRPEDMDELEIPQSVRVAIQTRVARLPEMHQEVLSLAAILGREFDFEVLAEASELVEDDLIEALESAEAAQLIEESGEADEVRFTFVHALIPAALVEGVRKLRRRKLHRRAAAAIEAIHPDDYEALANHHSESGDDARALEAYERAGERAAEAYANQEAEGHFRSALDLVEEPRKEANVRTQLGLMLDRLGRFEEAIEVWKRGIELYDSLSVPDEVAHLYARSTRAAWEAGDPKRGLEIAREGMQAVGEGSDGPGLADLYHETARALFFNGERDGGGEVVEKALEMAEQVGALRVQVEAMITYGTFSRLGAGESAEILQKAAQLAHGSHLSDQEARALNNSTVAYGWGLGQLDRAQEEALKARELARLTGSAALEIFYAANAIWYGMWTGALRSADEELERLLRVSDELGTPGAGRRMIESYRAMYLRFMGRSVEAIEKLQELHNIASEVNDSNNAWVTSIPLAELSLESGEHLEFAEKALLRALELSYNLSAWLSGLLARISARRGQLEQARARLEEAYRSAREDKALVDQLMLSLAEADLAVADGDHAKASSHFERAVQINEQCGMRWYRALTMMQWAAALTASGVEADFAKARELLQEARREFGEMGVTIYQQQADARLAEITS